MKKVISFFSETKEELKRVSWPNRQEVVNYLGLMIAVTLIVASFVGGIDFLLTKSLEKALLR